MSTISRINALIANSGLWRELLNEIPSYYMSIELCTILDAADKDARVSCRQQYVAPFDEYIVELPSADGCSLFFLVTHIPLNGIPRAKLIPFTVFRDGTVLSPGPETGPDAGKMYYNGSLRAMDKTRYDDWFRHVAKGSLIGFDLIALAFAARGVVQERVIPPIALSKARARRGKPPLREYTVLKIGSVTQRDGTERPVTDAERASRAMHLRAGHRRNQPCGPRWSERREIYVPPCIVNFTEGAEVRTPRRIVKL